jgi:AcrR family transcriptional regulator
MSSSAEQSLTIDPVSQKTRERVIFVATRLFAERGFDSVSLREITREANANIGAVNYHFGSKEVLIQEVFRTFAGPINELRLQELTSYEQEAGDGPLDPERVVRALVGPAIRSAADVRDVGHYMARLVVLARALPRPSITEVLSEEYDHIFNRFVFALSRAFPTLGREEICWRYDFTVGSMLYVVGYFDRTNRISRLTANLCDTTDLERIIDQFVAFIVDGLRAKNLPPKKRLSEGQLPHHRFRS